MPSVDDELNHLLFGDPSRRLVNFKIFRGSADVIDADDMKREIVSSLKRQREGGVVGSPHAPRSSRETVDLREFVAALD